MEIGDIAAVATAIGVGLTAWGLYLGRRQARVTFEDSITGDYREIVRRLPIEALLGQDVDETVIEASLLDFYAYIDLTNEQIFLRAKGRIGQARATCGDVSRMDRSSPQTPGCQ